MNKIHKPCNRKSNNRRKKIRPQVQMLLLFVKVSEKKEMRVVVAVFAEVELMVVGRCSFGWSCGGDEWRWAVSGEELLGFLVVNGERNTEREWMREEGWWSSTKRHSFRMCVIWAIWAGQGTCDPVFTTRARPFKSDWSRFHHPLGRLNPPNSFFFLRFLRVGLGCGYLSSPSSVT